MPSLRFLRRLNLNGYSVAALAISIAANVVVFSLLNAFVLRPLPVPDGDRIICLKEVDANGVSGSVSISMFRAWRNEREAFRQVAAFGVQDMNLTGRERPMALSAGRVSEDLFPIIGVKPAVGRLFEPEDYQGQDRAVVVLSHEFAQRRFGNAAALGQTLRLEDRIYTIIGVLPPELRLLSVQPHVWLPFSFGPAEMKTPFRRIIQSVIARLSDGRSISDAAAAARAVSARIGAEHPERRKGWSAEVVTLRDEWIGGIKSRLAALQGAAAAILLIACANVANFMLVRAVAKRREVATKIAIGASQQRILLEVIRDAVVTALIGCAFGIGLTFAAFPVMANMLPPTLLDRLPQGREALTVDWSVLAFSFAIAILAALVFSAAPVSQNLKANAADLLRAAGSRGATKSLGEKRLLKAIVVVQIAATTILLVAAGLLLKGYAVSRQINLGFRPAAVITGWIGLSGERYQTAEQRERACQEVVSNLRKIPGVISVGAANLLPHHTGQNTLSYSLAALDNLADKPRAEVRSVDQGYMQTLGFVLVDGRFFTEHDTATSMPIAIISQEVAKRFWRSRSAVGDTIRVYQNDGKVAVLTIAGVVENVHVPLTQSSGGTIYRPFAQTPAGMIYFAAKGNLGSSALFENMAKAVWRMDPEQPVDGPWALSEQIDLIMSPLRFQMLLTGVFSGISIALACVGIYGTIAYSASQRTGEIGIRMALGATPVDITRLLLGGNLKLIAVGLFLGLLGALWLGRIGAYLLPDVPSFDPMVFVVVTIGFTGIGILAGLMPAIRAAQVRPSDIIRE